MSRFSTPPVRATTATAIAVCLTLGTASCAGQETLAVCTSIPYEPFQFQDSWQDNEIVGFDVDMMDLVAERMGARQQVVDISFEQLDSGGALEEGTCDVTAAALTITPEREDAMSFSQSYYDADQALGSRTGTKLNELKDLTGKTLGVQRDSTGQDYADENQGRYDYRLKTFDNLARLQEAVIYQRVDAAIADVPAWTSRSTDTEGELEIIEEYDTGEEYGYAVALGNDELLDTINDVLDDSKINGDFKRIYEKWIGLDYES